MNEPVNNRILCIGGANVDHKMTLKGEFVPGTSNPVTSSESSGGVIRNVAENLGRLGASVDLMTIVGEDSRGRRILDRASEFMNTDESEITDRFSTGTYSALIDLKGDMLIGMADMEIASLMDDTWIQRHEKAIRSDSIVAADCNIEKSAMENIIAAVREAGNRLVIIGVSGPKTDRIPEDNKDVFLGIFNKDETQYFFRTDEENTDVLSKMWTDHGFKNAVVTAGKESVSYSGEDGEGRIKVKEAGYVADVTGAGDAFSAGVILGISQGKSLEESIRYGLSNARLTIQSEESVREDLTFEKLMEEVKNY